MKVYLVMQKPDNRVRGVFSTRQKAEEEIGPLEKEFIKCDACGQSKRNEAYEAWKEKLFIQERDMS